MCTDVYIILHLKPLITVTVAKALCNRFHLLYEKLEARSTCVRPRSKTCRLRNIGQRDIYSSFKVQTIRAAL